MSILAVPKPGPDVVMIEDQAGLDFAHLRDLLLSHFEKALIIKEVESMSPQNLEEEARGLQSSIIFLIGQNFSGERIYDLREGLKTLSMGLAGLVIKSEPSSSTCETEIRKFERVEKPLYHLGFRGETIRREYVLAVVDQEQVNNQISTQVQRAAYLAHLREISYLAVGIK